MFQSVRLKFSGLIESLVRYPLTVAFLTATAILIAESIGGSRDLIKFILTGAVGAVWCAAAQSAYERFFVGVRWRILLYLMALLFSAVFYLSIWRLSENSAEIVTRTAVAMFALLIAYIWVPVIKSHVSFNESFMAAFKALFQSVFFSGIIFLGSAAIIAAVDTLITPVDEKIYSYTANIVFVIIAPLFFLSLIPVFPGKADMLSGAKGDEKQREIMRKRTSCPKFLEVLLSYIIIPLAAVFSVILILYILLNIGGKFWTNNLLEPMLISYAITVIVITVLVGHLDNRFAKLFRAVFPKVLIPIALFQVIASILLLRETGVTFARYYVILFGVFAVFSGMALSLQPVRRSGVIAVFLIVLSAISLIPPIDAFTVSRNSQISSLEYVLRKNGMLRDDKIEPKENIPDTDKTRIIAAIQYLSEMDDLAQLKWLPADFAVYDDTAFYSTFGFYQYISANPEQRYISVNYNLTNTISIEGFDTLTQVGFPYPVMNETAKAFVVRDKNYSLLTEFDAGRYVISLKDAAGQELCRFNTAEIFTRYSSYTPTKNILTHEEASFSSENDKAVLKIIVLNASFMNKSETRDQFIQMLVLIKLK